MPRTRSCPFPPSMSRVSPAGGLVRPLAEAPGPRNDRRHSSAPSLHETPLGRLLARLFRLAASLRLAVVLLTLFTACLALATVLESIYAASVARSLVYRAWWFSLLLVLLAVNILCAALKKYPWKKHQVGFLITHSGLIVLVFGGLLTSLHGVEGMISLIDSDSEEVQKAAGAPQTSSTMALADQHCLEVLRYSERDIHDEETARAIQAFHCDSESPAQLQSLGSRFQALSFNPGPFCWASDRYLQPRLPWALNLLRVVAHPLDGLELALGAEVRLIVDNYYPHTEARRSHRSADLAPGLPSSSRPSPVPVQAEPGLDSPRLQPALRFSLAGLHSSAGSLDGNVLPDLWVRMGEPARQVHWGEDHLAVRYRRASQQLDFALRLNRAREVKDPGSERSAAFESEVTLIYGENGNEMSDRRIFMNHPLSHRGYQIYLASLERVALGRGGRSFATSRPVSRSGLQVSYDPGLRFKYAGSLLVVLGLATMFTMGAYFFQPSRA